jgi:ABC-type Co2+ transport system permease subunit
MKLEKDKFFAGFVMIFVLIVCLLIIIYNPKDIKSDDIKSKTYSIQIVFLNGEKIIRNYKLPEGTTVHLPNNKNELILINPYCKPPCISILTENVKSFKVN